MKKQFKLGCTLALIIGISSCQKPIPKDLNKENLIPKPSQLTATGSSFEWDEDTKIFVEKGSKSAKQIANYTKELLKPSTGFEIQIKEKESILNQKGIVLALADSLSRLKEEGYLLKIEEKRVTLLAHKAAGLFRGVQTIRQLLPAKIESDQLQQGPWLLASGTIEDQPQYGYRGAMLDVVRHFFSVEDVKQYIDYLAAYKMNVFHIHLTDDQGWRLEIKSWPKLATYGGSTQVGGGKGGYYTQEEYKEIVRYAAERYIKVIPEIDMPGHTNAALASYPELNADGKAPELYTGTHVGFSTLDSNKEITYQFIDDVIRELAALTPSEYIHIGGDESFATKKKDYIKFLNRVKKIVEKHGKKMMGWADISAASLDENTIAQFWHTRTKTALNAVKQNAQIVMSPARRAYMDMQYDTLSPLGLHWAGYTEVDDAYDWNLKDHVKGITNDHIIGIEAPLWAETIETMDDIEYLIFPRLLGYAEIGWTKDEDRNWNEYKIRLGLQKERFDFMKLNYYPSPLVEWKVKKEEKPKIES